MVNLLPDLKIYKLVFFQLSILMLFSSSCEVLKGVF